MGFISSVRSRITLIDAVIPLLLLYLTLFGFILQPYTDSTSQWVLLMRLTAGFLVLGLSSRYILARTSSSIPILPKQINWGLAFFSVIAGIFLLYFFFWSGTVVSPDYTTRFLAYYGDFNIAQPLFFPIAVALTLYVLSEELYFRGVVYTYARSKFGVPASIIFAALVFACAHLNFQISYFFLLLLLAFMSSILLEVTGVFLYGFIMHAALDIGALFVAMRSLHPYLLIDVPFRTLLLGVAVVAYGLYFLLGSRPTK